MSPANVYLMAAFMLMTVAASAGYCGFSFPTDRDQNDRIAALETRVAALSEEERP